MYRVDVADDLRRVVGSSQTATAAEQRMTEDSADASLVEAVRRGDREAFERLYRLYAPLVHGILLARVPRNEVEDIVQDVFLLAFRKLHTLRDNGAFGSWVAMIARNRAMDFHRRAQVGEELTEDIPYASGAETSGAGAKEILSIIRALPEAYRETLILRLVEGMSGPEIAARTGLQPDSVRVNLSRGMKMLREKLKKGERS